MGCFGLQYNNNIRHIIIILYTIDCGSIHELFYHFVECRKDRSLTIMIIIHTILYNRLYYNIRGQVLYAGSRRRLSGQEKSRRQPRIVYSNESNSRCTRVGTERGRRGLRNEKVSGEGGGLVRATTTTSVARPLRHHPYDRNTLYCRRRRSSSPFSRGRYSAHVAFNES